MLLSVPGEGRTASLYYTEDAYEQLADLVGVYDGTGTVDGSGAEPRDRAPESR